MKLPAYPRYKVSGVEWLGDVPSHWAVKPLKRELLRSASGGGLIKGEMATEPADGLVQAFSASGPDVWVDEAHYAGPGIVLSAVGARCGKAFKADGRWTAVANTHVFFPAVGRSRDYLWYVLNNENFWEKGGTAQPYVRVPSTLNRPFVFAPIEEQQAIADFLDRETAKIDALVAKKRTLIERLKERRTALISRTVTRGLPPAAARAAGLDPNPKLKPSGIDWLGDVPKHWDVRRIATDSTKITNGFVGPTRDILVDDGVPYLQSLHIKGNRIVFARPYFVEQQWSDEHSKSILRVDDVLIVQTGDIGQVAVVPREFAGANCHALIIVSPRCDRLSGAFLSQFLNSSFGFDELKRIETGALHPHLNCGLVRDVRFPSPPLQEQLAIVQFLGRETAKLDSMVTKVEAAGERLQEYRTALITAAVTGGVDVRGAGGLGESDGRRTAAPGGLRTWR